MATANCASTIGEVSCFIEHFQAESVGHAGNVVAYCPLQALFGYEALKVARHQLGLARESPEKNRFLENSI